MVEARLRVRLPDGVWVGRLSRAHPEVTFRLLAGMPVPEGAVELGELVGGDVASAAATVRAASVVHAYERLWTAEGRLVARYRTSETRLYELASAAGTPPRYPVVVRAGEATLDLSTTRAGLSTAVDRLRELGVGFDLRRLVETGPGAGVSVGADGGADRLTDRQREVLATAVDAGYYAVPRTGTLDDVAARLGVAASTASRTLRRAEARLARAALSDLADRR